LNKKHRKSVSYQDGFMNIFLIFLLIEVMLLTMDVLLSLELDSI